MDNYTSEEFSFDHYFCNTCGATPRRINVKRNPQGMYYCPRCGGMRLTPMVDAVSKEELEQTMGLVGDPNSAMNFGGSKKSRNKKKKSGRKPRIIYPVAQDAFSQRIEDAESNYEWKEYDRGNVDDKNDAILPTTVAGARKYVRDEFGTGDTCRCLACGQLANLYSKKINRTMVSFLGRLARMKDDPHYGKTKDGWVKVRTILGMHGNNLASASSQGASLRLWSLVHTPMKKSGEPHKGLYDISPLGRAFLRGQIKVPLHIYTYDNLVFAVSPERVSVREAYGEEFDYDEVLQALNLDEVLPYHVEKKKDDNDKDV